MNSIDWGVYLPMLKTLSLPLLLLVGKWLKGRSWVSNKVIPYATTGLNAAGWVLLQMGLVHLSNGQLVPVSPAPTPETLGMGAVAVPLYATLAFALPGWFGAIGGTVASIAIEQVFVNMGHKGLKYRRMFKMAESAGIIPSMQAKKLRTTSKW